MGKPTDNEVVVDQPYRTGVSSIDLPDTLRQGQLRQRIRDELIAELADTGEWLSKFDFGPPRRSEHADMRNYEVMYRTGPEARNAS